MPDNFLLIVFGILSLVGLSVGAGSFLLAVKYAKKPDGEVQMAIWAIIGMGGLVFAGMCWAYFLLPIMINTVF